MHKQESSALNITRFIMSIGIVFLHSYTSVQMYPSLGELTVYQQITRVLSMQFGEMAVPTFFLISGFLFYSGYTPTIQCYKYKLKKRFYSLLLPYLFWNIFLISIYYAVECIPSIRHLFNDSHQLVHNFTFPDYLKALWAMDNGYPMLTQLWFVRNLIILALGAPVIYLIVRYTRLIGVLIFGVAWMLHPGQAYPLSTLFFYSLGAWFSINNMNLVESMDKISKPLFIIYPIIMIMDPLLADTAISFYLHRTQTFTGVLFVIALISFLLKKGKIRDIAFLSSSSFFLYVAHDPMLRFIRKFSLKLADQNSELQMIIAYFSAIIIDIAIVYAVYWILQKYMPGFLKWTTGSR